MQSQTDAQDATRADRGQGADAMTKLRTRIARVTVMAVVAGAGFGALPSGGPSIAGVGAPAAAQARMIPFPGGWARQIWKCQRNGPWIQCRRVQEWA